MKKLIKKIKRFIKRVIGKLRKLTEKHDNTADEERKAQMRDQHIRSIMLKTGWTREETVRNVREARSRIGISYKYYDRGNFHNIPIEDQKARLDELTATINDRDKLREQRVCELEEITGWSHEKCAETLKMARQKGMGAGDYIRYKMYEHPEEDVEYFIEKRKKTSKKKRKEKKNEAYIQIVMEETGWSHDEAKQNMDRSADLCGAEYEDYVVFRFWEKSKKVQKTYFTKGDSNALRKKYNTREAVPCFMNKCEFNRIFAEYLGRPWAYSNDVTLDEFKDRFSSESRIMYKPLKGTCGKGICVYEINEENIDEIYEQIASSPEGIVEGYITQHHEMQKFSRNAVNTVRVVTVRKDGEVNLMYATFRMAGGDSVVDNFHSGGVLAVVDTETGVLLTDAFSLDGKRFENHPETGEKVKGFAIPYWDEIRAMLKKAGMIVEGIGYVGWDIAVTENGPVLIEGNTDPGTKGLQISYDYEGKGMKYITEKFL